MKQTNQLSIFSKPAIVNLEERKSTDLKNNIASLLSEIETISKNSYQIAPFYYKELKKCHSNRLYSKDKLQQEVINLREWVRIYANINTTIAKSDAIKYCKDILFELYKK